MNKKKYLFLILFDFILYFLLTDNVKAIDPNMAKKIIEYSGANGSENDVALTSGCDIAYEYFTIGGERFDDNVTAEEVAVAYCEYQKNDQNAYSSCLNAKTDAARNQLINIRNDAKNKGYKLNNGSYSKSLGYVKGCYRNSYVGVRVSIVNADGTQKKGTKILDFWTSDPKKIYGDIKKSDKIRSLIVNGSNPLFRTVPSIGGNIDSAMGDYTNARITLKNEVIESSNTKQVLPDGYLKKLGINKWEDFDDDDHILFEPLFVVTIKNTSYIGTGTEIFYLLMYREKEATWLQYDFITQITSKMVLVEKSDDEKDDTEQTYTLNSNGVKYSTYDNIPQGTNELKNDPNIVLKKANGYAMELIWLKPYIIDKHPLCCIPCDTGDEKLNKQLAKYLENFNQENGTNEVCDPYNCEGEDEIATGIDSSGNLVCEPYTHDDCCDPSKEDCCIIGTQLCDGSVVDEQYYNLYCSQDNGCKYPINLPNAQTGVCTTDNSDNKSIFEDGNFSDIIYDYKNLFYQDEIKIYQPENTSTYCETYCQEKIIIELPKNYPYANAGRYFTWTISDKDDSLVKETVEKNCATDIKLDKWMNDYRTKIIEIENALSKWNEKGIYSDISGENLAKRRTELNTAMRKCIASAKGSSNEILEGMTEEGKNKIGNDALKEVEDTGDVKETGIEKKIKKDNKNKADELSSLYSDFNNISKNELEEKCGNQCTVEMTFGGFYKINPNDLPKDKDSEEYKNLIESEKEKIKREAIVASIAAEIQSRVNACISQFDGGYVQTLANAKGDILKEHRNNSGDIENYTFEGNNPENATLNSLISDLKKCQYNYDENEDTEKSNVKNTLLNLNFLYSTYLSTSEYSNSDIDVTTTNSSITSSKGCIQITENEECNPNLIFESSSCRTGKVIVNDKTMYLISSLPGLLNSNKSYNYENLLNYWNSYFFAKSRFENEYKLKNNINACVCKDGTIINANDDGSCECPDMSSKTEIIADISNQYSCYFEWKTTKYYTTISSGNLSVEYMTPTGLYPLSLDYSNIGTNGHFSQLMKDGVLKNVSHCEDGTCHYSDEDGKCYFIVDNEVIIDGGFIEDSICPEGICEPDDKCTGGDCSNFCEVGKCSNDSSVGGMEIIYRQIDLNNPFPDREPGKNWQGNEEIITNNRDVDGNKLYSSNLEPIYSITMTPSTIKEIRKVNNALNYDYSSISTMLFDDNKITGGVSYVLRGNLKDIAEKTGGSFTINLNDANTSGRFDDIINNTKVDNSGNLATCREKASEMLK